MSVVLNALVTAVQHVGLGEWLATNIVLTSFDYIGQWQHYLNVHAYAYFEQFFDQPRSLPSKSVLLKIFVSLLATVICIMANIYFRRLDRDIAKAMRDGELALDCCFNALGISLSTSLVYLEASSFLSRTTGLPLVQRSFSPDVTVISLKTFEHSVTLVIAAGVGLIGLRRILCTGCQRTSRWERLVEIVSGLVLMLPFSLVVISIANPNVWTYLNRGLVDGLSLLWALLVPIAVGLISLFSAVVLQRLRDGALNEAYRNIVSKVSLFAGGSALLISSAFAEYGMAYLKIQ